MEASYVHNHWSWLCGAPLAPVCSTTGAKGDAFVPPTTGANGPYKLMQIPYFLLVVVGGQHRQASFATPSM
jgi:hypothetical protein